MLYIIQVDHRLDSVQKEMRDLGFEFHDYINRNKEDLQSIRTYLRIFFILDIIFWSFIIHA